MDGMSGEVVLNHVTFGYNPDKVILKDISLYAKPGQKIAFEPYERIPDNAGARTSLYFPCLCIRERHIPI